MREIAVLGPISPAQRTEFKAAKARLGISEPLKFVEARPGCGRVVSFGPDHDPEFATDWIVLHGADPEDVEAVLGWVLGMTFDWRAYGIDRWLEIAMGRPGVREIV